MMKSAKLLSEHDVQRLAQMAGLEISSAYLASVTRNLEILLEQADLLQQLPIEPQVEPAPVFRP